MCPAVYMLFISSVSSHCIYTILTFRRRAHRHTHMHVDTHTDTHTSRQKMPNIPLFVTQQTKREKKIWSKNWSMRVTSLIGVQPVMPAGEVKISSVLKPHKSHKNKQLLRVFFVVPETRQLRSAEWVTSERMIHLPSSESGYSWRPRRRHSRFGTAALSFSVLVFCFFLPVFFSFATTTSSH